MNKQRLRHPSQKANTTHTSNAHKINISHILLPQIAINTNHLRIRSATSDPHPPGYPPGHPPGHRAAETSRGPGGEGERPRAERPETERQLSRSPSLPCAICNASELASTCNAQLQRSFSSLTTASLLALPSSITFRSLSSFFLPLVITLRVFVPCACRHRQRQRHKHKIDR